MTPAVADARAEIVSRIATSSALMRAHQHIITERQDELARVRTEKSLAEAELRGFDRASELLAPAARELPGSLDPAWLAAE